MISFAPHRGGETKKVTKAAPQKQKKRASLSCCNPQAKTGKLSPTSIIILVPIANIKEAIDICLQADFGSLMPTCLANRLSLNARLPFSARLIATSIDECDRSV